MPVENPMPNEKQTLKPLKPASLRSVRTLRASKALTLRPASLKTAVRAEKVKTKPPVKSTHRFLRLPNREKILLFKHLSVMLESGIPLQEALEVLRDQMMSPAVRTIFSSALADLADGFQLSWSLNKFPHIFESFITSVIEVGEESGTLPNQMKYVAIQLEKSQEIKGKIRAALLYPLIVLIGAFSIGIYLAFFLLPKLLPLFSSLKIDLPFTTRVMIALSGALIGYWHYALVGFVVLIVTCALLWRLSPVRYAGHRLSLSAPIFGRLIRDSQVAQITRVLGTLLQSGLHIVQAIRVTSASTSNLVYKKYLLLVAKDVERGEDLSETLKKYPKLFSKTMISMVGIGERTGNLSTALLALAEFSEREVDNTTKNLSTLIEPALLLFVGVIVGFVALSIITPIYQLTQGMTQ